MPIDRPSPGTRALLAFVPTLIFSRTFDVSGDATDMGLTRLVDDLADSIVFLR